MKVEDQLRRVLADDRYALEAWPDPVGRVASGVQRRIRRRRASVVVSIVVLAAALGAPSALRWKSEAAPIGPAGNDRVVPWRPDPAPASTNLARRGPRPDARDCTATDLNPKAWVDSAAGGKYTVLLTNNSESRCTLRGSSQIVATDMATGRRGAVVTEHVAAVDDASQYPATVDPGEAARIDLVTTNECASESRRPARYRVALVMLGREFPVSELELVTGCPVGVGSWRVLPSLLNVPFIVASIQAPDTVQRGRALAYEVTLLNSGRQPYHLEPCPRFTQRLAGAAETHLLNCAVTRIDPQQVARFQMRIPVPADAAPGKVNLTWTAVASDGKVIIADLATGGVAIEILI